MMDFQVIKVKEDVLQENNKRADELRKYLKNKGIYFINVMASPGSGKTTLLTGLINKLKEKYNIGVMEADIDGDVDAKRIHELTGVRTIQVHTSGACHLTAQMTHDAINAFDIKDLDLLFLENVGNLVCPAEFDTGSNINMMLLSVPEGEDKPLKYPLMFEVSDIAVITKTDTKKVFDFNEEKCQEYIKRRNPKAKIFITSAIKDEGVKPLADYISSLIEANK
ncbi:MAG: hydrogenase nickel incorporation protein HypB [Bacilli bacterium]|nr:hydrogenase nickel incorporation protein HypB [Bacilli bacterium]